MNESIYNGLLFPTKLVNREYLIKINRDHDKGGRISTLVGVSGLINFIGIDLANKAIKKAMQYKGDIFIYRLRRGITVRFYRH